MTAVQWPCASGAHDACLSSSRSCSCSCHRSTFTEKAAYLAWRHWDRLLDKALDCWEIKTMSPDPLVPKNPTRDVADCVSQRSGDGSSRPSTSLVEAPASLPPSVPAAAEPPSELEVDATSDSGGGRELEELRLKVARFDSRHPSLLGPL